MTRFLIALVLSLFTAAPSIAQQILGGVNLPGVPPANSIGNESNWYIDFNTGKIYGPKSFGVWPATANTFLINGTTQCTVSTPAVLASANFGTCSSVIMLGYNSADDGGGGLLIQNGSTAANSCTIFNDNASHAFYRLDYKTTISTRGCGAYGDNSHNDWTALNNWFAALMASSTAAGHIEGGTYYYINPTPTTVTITQASPAVATFVGPYAIRSSTPIKFATSGTLPSPLVAGTTYYTLSTGLTTTTLPTGQVQTSFQFAATNGGAAINTTTAGSGTFTMPSGVGLVWDFTPRLNLGAKINGDGRTQSVLNCGQMVGNCLQMQLGLPNVAAISNSSPAVVTQTNGYGANQQVYFTASAGGSLPTGISAGVPYYVISAGLTSSQFQVSTTSGGAAVNTSSTGSGTFYVTAPNVTGYISIADMSVYGVLNSGDVWSFGRQSYAEGFESSLFTNIGALNFGANEQGTAAMALNGILTSTFNNITGGSNPATNAFPGVGIGIRMTAVAQSHFDVMSTGNGYIGVYITNPGNTAWPVYGNFITPDIENTCFAIKQDSSSAYGNTFKAGSMYTINAACSGYAVSVSAAGRSTPGSVLRIEDVVMNYNALYGTSLISPALDPNNQIGVIFIGGTYGSSTATTPAFPASGAIYTNTTGQVQHVNLAGNGVFSSMLINGNAVANLTVSFDLNPGDQFVSSYTGTPTWKFRNLVN